MTDSPGAGLALDLARRLLAPRTADDAAQVLAAWLQEQDGHTWTVLAVEAPTTCRVVTGPDAGREVVPPGSATAITTGLGTWGHLATDGGDASLAGPAAAALGAALDALQHDAELHDRIDRLEEAQAVAHMGSYDWDIATDVNRWSDELYRIYGHEPQSFNASYERFQSMIHPDDRERVAAIHQEAYATGEPYHTVERIVRPDGEVRVLDTTGRVIRDAAGTPVRMAGVCIDITDRWRDQQEATRAADRFRALVETAPDAIVVVDQDGRITQVNRRAAALFADDETTLLDGTVRDLLPDGLPVPESSEGPVAERRDVTARRADGTSFRADVTVGTTENDEHLHVAFVRDATARLDEEAQRERHRSAEMRRRQALEINDNVLQGLAATRYALEVGDVEGATEVTEATLASARHMVADLLADLDEEGLLPGSLVRARPAPSAGSSSEEPTGPPLETAADDDRAVRVVLVDDAEDLRLVFRIALEAAGGFQVVAEAGDGEQALTVCREHRPDLVLLDLSMPVMDGLEVLPVLREDLPDTVVVVLSGLGAAEAERRVLELGAVAYLEKGMPQSAMVERLRAVTGAAAIT